MCENLQEILQNKYSIMFNPANAQHRCILHALNRVAQTILSLLNDALDPEDVDYFVEDPFGGLLYEALDDEALLEVEANGAEITEPGVPSEAELKDAKLHTLTPEDLGSPIKKVCCSM